LRMSGCEIDDEDVVTLVKENLKRDEMMVDFNVFCNQQKLKLGNLLLLQNAINDFINDQKSAGKTHDPRIARKTSDNSKHGRNRQKNDKEAAEPTSAMATSTSTPNSKETKPGKKGKGGKGHRDAEGSKQQSFTPSSTKPCVHCGGKDHSLLDCAKLLADLNAKNSKAQQHQARMLQVEGQNFIKEFVSMELEQSIQSATTEYQENLQISIPYEIYVSRPLPKSYHDVKMANDTGASGHSIPDASFCNRKVKLDNHIMVRSATGTTAINTAGINYGIKEIFLELPSCPLEPQRCTQGWFQICVG